MTIPGQGGENRDAELDKLWSEVTDWIRRYEARYPELLPDVQSGDELVREPVYRYEAHAIG